MSTRAAIRVFDAENNCLVYLYHHSDGYPSYLGVKLFEFLSNGELVNGISIREKHQFNGIEDLAAQLVAYCKLGEQMTGDIMIGNTYIYPPNFTLGNADERYCYDIKKVAYENVGDDAFKIYFEGFSIDYKTKELKSLFSGDISELTEKQIIDSEGNGE